MTDSKRRSTVTKPFEEFTFCEEFTSPIDTLFTPLQKVRSPICALFTEHSVKFLEAKILEKPSDFPSMVKLRMKDFLKFVEEGVPISGEDAKSLMCGVWLSPCFVHSLAAAIDYHDDMIGSVMCYSNQVSVADRTAHMEADPYFKLSVMCLKEPTSTSTFLRLFLSILIGHWGDEGLLRVLDQKMGKNVFGRRLDIIAKGKARAIERAGKVDEIEDFSYVIEDVSHAKDMEPLRKLMVDRYGPREDIDIEALLEKIKKDLSNLLSISQNYLGYDGKKTEIFVSVAFALAVGSLFWVEDHEIAWIDGEVIVASRDDFKKIEKLSGMLHCLDNHSSSKHVYYAEDRKMAASYRELETRKNRVQELERIYMDAERIAGINLF
ncbi:probable U3 small nucleolar RNA-associated protein 11 [Phtheirospermum japonicum]|uniref:Probable U3 small nucleolar RNA-associated protein 11 n=1 Tax=Phtheirospermum japonicum TaxID=374723 RepID=A0A830C5U2_9LAMI|nr:probable U3 small nucleolar RNA-associated protein 11 [Phtheirospermum japonicum]